jgi:hypothetical protein
MPWPIGFMLGEGGVSSVFLMFAGVAVLGLIASTRMIETRNMLWRTSRADRRPWPDRTAPPPGLTR